MKITTETVRRFALEHVERLLPLGFSGRFFLAGGCFRSLIHDKPPNDLDLWPASSEDRNLLLESLQSQGSVVLAENYPFNTILTNPAFPFRLEVTYKCPTSIEESVADFDIQLACIAAEYSNGGIERVFIHPGVSECISLKEVRAVSRLLPMKYSLRTLKRLDRYGQDLGYRVCEESHRRVWDIYTAACEEERKELLDAAGLIIDDVPGYAAIQRVFVEGRPSEPCRPFNSDELEALRESLIPSRSSSSTSPLAVFVVGLPGAGKGTVLKEILLSLGLSLERMANLDMDVIRSFHSQIRTELLGTPGGGNTVHILKDLIPWFQEGSKVEQSLYKNENSIVRELLDRKCDFVLPVHSLDSLEFMQYVCGEHNYTPYLIEIHVLLEVALERALIRAKVTGRFTPPQYIEDSVSLLAEALPVFQNFVQSQKGGKVASFDNSRKGGGGLGAPARILQSS